MKTKILIAALALILAPAVVAAQEFESPDSPAPGPYTGAPSAIGDVIASVPVGFGGTKVGLEDDGNGNLLYTDITNDEIGTMTTGGVQIAPLFTVAAAINPIGITTDGSLIYITDTNADTVEAFTMAGAPSGSFPVAAQTTFPEGVTYHQNDGTLWVVDGTATAPVDIDEFTTAGATTGRAIPLATGSNDGDAYDPATCSIWTYASTEDQVTQFDPADGTILTTFAGTAAAGAGTGEGVAVVNEVLYIMAAGSSTLVSFDIAGAPQAANCELPNPVEVPTLNTVGLVLIVGLLALASLFVLRRRAV